MQKGQVIANEFMLQRPLVEEPGEEVWRCLELSVGRMVAIRFVPGEFAALDELRNRLEKLGSFRHPHSVPADRLAETADTGPLIVARYVDGPFLDDYAAQWVRAEGTFPFNLLFDVLRPVAAMLDAAHEASLVHRSLSPNRIVVSQTDGVQVFDLELGGLIRERLELASTASQLRYRAPEQFSGRSASPFSDQYSLAAIAWELLANKPLFDAAVPKELRDRILSSPVPPIIGFPDHVNRTLARALDKDPARRFSNCTVFLDTLAGSGPVVAPPPIVAAFETKPFETAVATEPGPFPFRDAVPPPVLLPEPDASHERILAGARNAKADRVAEKIDKERRMRRFFWGWNLLIALGCIVAAFVFREQLGFGAKGHDGSPAAPKETFEGTETPAKSGSGKPARIVRVRQPRKPKEERFDMSNESSFRNIDGTESPDKVRFLGTSASGKKIVFVLDASSPMGGGARSPWDHVQKEVAHSFRDLNASQWFQVVCFNEDANLLPDGQGPEHWISPSPKTLKESHDFLRNLEPSGLGDPRKALEEAAKLRPDVVFFLSDEKCTKLPLEGLDALKRSLGSAVLCVVEIGSGMEPAKATPSAELARRCGGQYRWIDGDLHRLQR